MFDSDRLNVSRRNLLRAGALAGAGSLFAGGPLGAALARAAETGSTEAQWPAVAALLDKYMATGKLAGMLAALGWGTGDPGYIVRGREGFDDKDPERPESLFRAYSMTKPVTGMAAMILVDEGKLKLDQPLADFAPEFTRMQVAIDPAKSLAALPTDTLITIRHLLTHTSGLGYASIGQDASSKEMSRLGLNAGIVSKLNIPPYDSRKPTPGPDEFLRQVSKMPLLFQPGARWSYSIGLDVLAIVIARVTGQSYEAFLAERLFGPLGMASSTFRVPASARGRLTTNYLLNKDATPLAIDKPGSSIYEDAPPFAFGGSGLVTSPRDYDRFLAMIINKGLAQDGRRVMSEAVVAMGTSDLLPAGADTSRSFVGANRFGAGGIVGTGRDTGLYGWSGAAGTIGYAQTRLGLRSSLWVQYMPSGSLPLLAEFPKAIGADLVARGKSA